MIFHSIKWRLQAWHALILIVVLSGFGFTAYQLDRVSRLQRIDRELQQRADILLRALRQGQGPGPRGGSPRDGERTPPEERRESEFPPPGSDGPGRPGP